MQTNSEIERKFHTGSRPCCSRVKNSAADGRQDVT